MTHTRVPLSAELVREAERLAELTRYRVLDTEAEDAFDDLTRLAAQVCRTPMALVSLVDADRQWFKSRLGVDLCSTTRETSFCAHALGQAEILVVPDARLDPRFVDNPLVTGEPLIRFYAGAPLITADGHTLGTLCVLDTESRTLDAVQLEQLAALARQVMSQLVLRRQALELAAEVAAHRRSQRALDRNQRLLDGVLAATDALIYAKDLDGNFLLANPALRKLAGLPTVDILGASDSELFPESSSGTFQRNDMTVAVTGTRQVFTEALTHPDGVVHEYISTKFPLHDEVGQVYAVAGVSTDVTEMARQRHILQESERRWQDMVERSPTAVVVVTADGRIAYANPPAASVYGLRTTGDLIGRSALEFVLEVDHKDTRELFASVLRGETLVGRRHRLRQPGGVILDVDLHAAPAEFESQPAVQIELRDITVQHRAEIALRDSEARWRILFEGSPVGIGLSDENGHFVSVNPALCALLGRAEADILGRSSVEYTHPDDTRLNDEATELIEASPDGILRIEKRYVRPDGTLRWAGLTITHTVGPAGQTWTLAHIQDITERKAALQSVQDSEANLSAVAAVVQRIQSGADARQTIVEAGLQLAHASFVCFIEPDAGRSVLRVTNSTAPTLVGTSIPIAHTSATANVFSSGQELFLSDPAEHPLVSQPMLRMTMARSLYVTPVRSGGEVTAVLLVAWSHRVTDMDDRRARVVSLLADHAGVALRQEGLLAELQALALTDPLTLLPNRRHWDRSVHDLLAAAIRSGQPLTVAIADLDHFKQYNDLHGHPSGDELLREFGETASASVRVGDVVSRWGGEEFALALPNCSAPDAVPVLERIRCTVPAGQTCSIGFATWDRAETADELLARVDRALYVAKESGRNRIQPALAGMPST